jgi:ATP-binding cassette subfamily B multidrug efflux pump
VSFSTRALDSDRHLARDRVRPAQRSLPQLEKQDSGYYQRYRTGDIMARMTNDLNAVRQLLGRPSCTAPTRSSSPLALYFLLRISPWLTLVALAPMPIASILVQYFGTQAFTSASSASRPAFLRDHAQAQENFSGARLVRAFAREESQIASFEKANREYIAARLRLVQLMGMLWPTLEFVLGVSMVITLLAGGHLVLRTASRSMWAILSPSTPT